MREGKRLPGYVVAYQTLVIEASSLLPGTSAQKVELIALT